MKKVLHFFSGLLCLLCTSSPTFAEFNYQCWEIQDGIKYYFDIENKLACVAPCNDKTITGDVIIPSELNPRYYEGTFTVTSISQVAFSDCSKITSITIPNTVTSIEVEAFGNCTSLKSVSLPESITEIQTTTFFNCSSLTSISIPKTVKSIGTDAFSYCTNLTNIDIPYGVIQIKGGAFRNCTSLASIKLPESISTIDQETFSGCTSLESIDMNSVRSIESHAFYGCCKLPSIFIPSGTSRICSDAFIGCESLVNIEVDNTNKYYASRDGILFTKESHSHGTWSKPVLTNEIKGLVTYPAGRKNKEYIIPDGIECLNSSCFSACKYLTSVTIPSSVKGIENFAFMDCSNLEHVNIPNSLIQLYSGVFWNCSSLQSITIPESLTFIPEMTFMGCVNLESIIIPNSVTEIGFLAFGGCNNLKQIISEALTPPISDIEGNYFFDFENDSFENTILYVPKTAVDAYKQDNIWSHFKQILPYVNNEIVTIGNLQYILKLDQTAIVTYAHQNSLSNYEGLTTVQIPETIEYEGTTYTVTTIGDEAFNYCWGLKSVSLPSTLTRIGKLAFGYCTSLRSVSIPDNITEIDDEAFTGCSALASAEIGNSVERIGDYAFFGCTGIGTLHVPESVQTIGDNAFMGIHWVDEVHAHAAIPANAPVSAFSNNAYRNATLVVPVGASEIYKSHPTWSNFMTIREVDSPVVGIESVGESTSTIQIDGNAIAVSGAEMVKIFTTSGTEIYSGKSGRIEVASGLYIVIADGITRKIRI